MPLFLQLAWNTLESGERELILQRFPSTTIPPLTVQSIADLDVMGVLDKLKRKAAKAAKFFEENSDSELAQAGATIVDGPLVQALFTLDFTETKKRMLQRFEAWLNLPENQTRFATFADDPTGTTGIFKDRLKDLAVWRLSDEMGFDDLLEFTRANRKKFDRDITIGDTRYHKGDSMPFYGARREQSSHLPLNQSPLFSEPGGCQRAMDRARAFLAEIIPCEGLGKYAPPASPDG